MANVTVAPGPGSGSNSGMADAFTPATRRAFLALAAGLAPALVAARTRRPAGQETVRSGTLGSRRRVVSLAAPLDHPQGLTASADRTTWLVTSVVRASKTGVLAAFRASDGSLVRRVEVQDGPRYHPGGLDRLGDTLWLPVAEYRRASTSVVQARDVATLAVRSSFAVADHIGAVAATGAGLIGCNWDARLFYGWTPDGRETARVEHLGAARYQDLQWMGDALLAGGLLGDTGVIDRLGWPSLDLQERIVVGATDRGVVLTHEGMAVAGDEVLLMPEDDPTRVFVHEWTSARVVSDTSGPPAAVTPPTSPNEPEKSLFRKPRP